MSKEGKRKKSNEKSKLRQAVMYKDKKNGSKPNVDFENTILIEEGANVTVALTAHDYTCSSGHSNIEVTEVEELSGFDTLPGTPIKSPAPKRGKIDTQPVSGPNMEINIITELKRVINDRADGLEKLIGENAIKIEGLKKTVDFICAEVKEMQNKIKQVERRINKTEGRLDACESKISEIERYKRRWDLKLYGVPENDNENIRLEVIQICQSLIPDAKMKIPDVIDTVHRLGKKQLINIRPRGIILQFSLRHYRDAIWKAAKKSTFLKEQGYRFAEDLSPADRETRRQLWPTIEKARNEGKRAYFVGARAFIDGVEVRSPFKTT